MIGTIGVNGKADFHFLCGHPPNFSRSSADFPDSLCSNVNQEVCFSCLPVTAQDDLHLIIE
jgi:hypothetical protein